MPEWTKSAARYRMKNNPRLQEILAIEPRLNPILKQADLQYHQPEYHRYRTYLELRNLAISLVGWHSECEQLRNSDDYLLVINTILDLLPPDDNDLDIEDPFACLYA